VSPKSRWRRLRILVNILSRNLIWNVENKKVGSVKQSRSFFFATFFFYFLSASITARYYMLGYQLKIMKYKAA